MNQKNRLLTGGLTVLFVGVLSAVALLFSKRPATEPLPVYGDLAPFRLVSQESRPFELSHLKGQISVVNFIFTSCPMVCPRMTRQMKALETESREMGKAVQFVSISVDPATDTPAVLKRYGEQYEANFDRWTFLTGSLEELQSVVVKGFKIAMDGEAKAEEDNMWAITHGEHFVVVDEQARIRAFQKVENTEDRRQLLAVVKRLVESSPSSALAE